jgi:hypothetical protein
MKFGQCSIGSCRLECTGRVCPVKTNSKINKMVSIHGGREIVGFFSKATVFRSGTILSIVSKSYSC